MNLKSYDLFIHNKSKHAMSIICFLFIAILFLIYGVTLMYIYSCFLLFIFSECSKTDLDRRIIPNTYMIVGLGVGVCEAIQYFTISESFYDNFKDAALGLLVLPVILFIASLIFEIFIKKEAIGMGDIKAFAIVGFVLGYQYQFVFAFFTLVLAFIIGTILAIKEKSIKVAIPMAPSMFFSLFITLAIVGITMA